MELWLQAGATTEAQVPENSEEVRASEDKLRSQLQAQVRLFN